MTVFHEVYGTYFRIAAKLLSQKTLTQKDIQRVVAEDGFRDSVLFLPQKLIPQKDGSDWGFFTRDQDGTLSPVLKHPPEHILTRLQKRWLKAKLSDPRMRLFLTEDAFAALSEALRDIPPLYQPAWLRYPDRFTDGDPYDDPQYRSIFRTVLDALKSQQMLEIDYTTSRGKPLRSHVLPLRLEYSEKNDKFRLYCIPTAAGRRNKGLVINLGRINTAKTRSAAAAAPVSLDDLFSARKCSEPVTVRVTSERNGTERFLMEFASYEKRTDRDLDTGDLTVQLWYDKQDETELLIQLLSFGPVLEILSPPAFRKQAAERVRRQLALLESEEMSGALKPEQS